MGHNFYIYKQSSTQTHFLVSNQIRKFFNTHRSKGTSFKLQFKKTGKAFSLTTNSACPLTISKDVANVEVA